MRTSGADTVTLIYANVLAAMQEAEELGGPEGDDYVALMRMIAREAQARAERFEAGR